VLFHLFLTISKKIDKEPCSLRSFRQTTNAFPDFYRGYCHIDRNINSNDITAFFIPTMVGRFFYRIVEVVIDAANLAATHHQVVTITNYGSEPATNLIVFVKTRSKLVSVTNQFSTAEVAVK
jgi:hypothetical protein